MTEYLEKEELFVKLNGTWTEIPITDVVGRIYGRWGITGNSPTDRTADSGVLQFVLNNVTKQYSPGLVGSLAGWQKGIEIVYICTYDGSEHRRFFGTILGIGLETSAYSARRVKVTAADFMDYSARYPLQSPQVELDKRGNDAMGTIIENMPKQPQRREFDTGVNVFPSVFDIVENTTTAFAEFNKISQSEIGFIYSRKDPRTGETLVFESSDRRSGDDPLSSIPLSVSASTAKLMEDDTAKIMEDGTTAKVMDERETFSSDNTMTRLDVRYGEDMINRFTVYAYPREKDETLSVLYSLGTPLEVAGGATETFSAKYFAQDGGTIINGVDMEEPVATTDYTANTLADGTGTDKTDDIEVVASYTSHSVEYTVTNNYGLPVFITKLQARGFGVRLDGQIQYENINQDSIDSFGFASRILDQKYKGDLTQGKSFVDSFVMQDKEPRTVVEKVFFIANRSSTLMNAFLSLDVGSKVALKEDQSGVDAEYYIQNVEMSIVPGGLIKFGWTVREAPPNFANGGLTPINIVTTNGVDSTIDFGFLSRLWSLDTLAMSAWIYPTAITSAEYFLSMFSFDVVGGNKGYLIGVQLDGLSGFNFVGILHDGDDGTITATDHSAGTGADAIALNSWNHVTVTIDRANGVYKVPYIYIGGIEKDLDIGPSGGIYINQGSMPDDTTPIGIGYVRSPSGVITGKIADCRFYDHALTQAEVTTLFNAGRDGTNTLDGLLFHAPFAPTADLADYDGQALTADTPLFDNIKFSVGTPIGTVTGDDS